MNKGTYRAAFAEQQIHEPWLAHVRRALWQSTSLARSLPYILRRLGHEYASPMLRGARELEQIFWREIFRDLVEDRRDY